MNERARRSAISMWGLGFATALLVDAVLFDGRSWLSWPVIAALLAMAVHTVRRDQQPRSRTRDSHDA